MPGFVIIHGSILSCKMCEMSGAGRWQSISLLKIRSLLTQVLKLSVHGFSSIYTRCNKFQDSNTTTGIHVSHCFFFRKGFSYLIYSYYISFVTSSASVLEHNPVSLLLGDGACLNLFRSQVMYCKRSQKIHKKLKLSVCQLAIFGVFCNQLWCTLLAK